MHEKNRLGICWDEAKIRLHDKPPVIREIAQIGYTAVLWARRSELDMWICYPIYDDHDGVVSEHQLTEISPK
jgi:hypothetical protein